ncbi:MAG TPA: hypothetical protein VJS68_03680, partial [Thermoplasmata archaeon]|nr:hypothetical protein [Thermoplasmata archaeon]
MAVLASLLLVSLPAWALPAPSPANASAPLGPGVQPLGSSAAPSGTWAWGASANLSLSVQIVGAYDATQNLSGGNLTQNGAYVSLSESAAMRYAAYAIVNETSPSASQRYVVLQAAEYEHLALGIAASGTFPAPGNYSNGSSVPLQPMNISLQASVEVLNYYRAFLNFTSGANGSLALNDEHVQALRAFNLSLAATNFPNATTNATGQVDLKYVSGAISVRGWVAGDLRANFTPALPLVEGPLFVGKS